MRRIFPLTIALLVLAACNLDAPGGLPPPTTLEPTNDRPTFVAPTPYIAPTLIPQQGFSSQTVTTPSVVPTNAPQNLLTPVPAQTLIQNPQPPATSQNAIEAFINNLIIPIWNFIYTFVLEGVSTLWLFAGARGGPIAQVLCCIAPFIAAVIGVLLRFRVLRWRR